MKIDVYELFITALIIFFISDIFYCIADLVLSFSVFVLVCLILDIVFSILLIGIYIKNVLKNSLP